MKRKAFRQHLLSQSTLSPPRIQADRLNACRTRWGGCKKRPAGALRRGCGLALPGDSMVADWGLIPRGQPFCVFGMRSPLMRHLRLRQATHLPYRRVRGTAPLRWDRITDLRGMLRSGGYDWSWILWVVSGRLVRLKRSKSR